MRLASMRFERVDSLNRPRNLASPLPVISVLVKPLIFKERGGFLRGKCNLKFYRDLEFEK